MKNFYRIKKIHGKEYKYEITPYYDKEKRKSDRNQGILDPLVMGSLWREL
jgi:transposase, IS4 family